MSSTLHNFKNSSFLYACKENYYRGIAIGSPDARLSEGYRGLVEISKTYFSNNIYEPVLEYLNEKRYQTQLWSAYILLEYGSISQNTGIRCLEILEEYFETSKNMLSPQELQFFTEFLTDKRATL